MANLKRREFLRVSGKLALLSTVPLYAYPTDTIAPAISLAERNARISKAQKLLKDHKMDALLLDAGTSLQYFSGIRWWPSERTMVAIIPANGSICYVCPAFEEDRLKEQIVVGNLVRTWQEDESPYQLIVNTLKILGLPYSKLAVEEQTRFFIINGIKKAAPKIQIVSADPITVACRIIKSPAEIQLMQRANDITLEAIKKGVAQMYEGMSQSDLSRSIMQAQASLGGQPDFALCLFAESSAYPHGSKQAKKLRKGDIVLMDCGCMVEGYSSDITRTVVFGNEPSPRQIEIWELEKQAQAAGFAAAQIGASCEAVDAAARKVLTEAGFGPGYKLPGLPHRTGHGIGMDGHEWGNIVKGNKDTLKPGMCFSIEPTIAIPGEFGVRLEDCVYMTESGPRWFSTPSKSIFEPFA